MKILVIDQLGLALDFCMRCEAAGHTIKLFVAPTKEGKRKKIGDGLMSKVPDWKPHMNWADLIVTTDNSSLMEELTPYQKKGYPIFGSNIKGAEIELDRQKGQNLFKSVGMDVMACVEFNDYDKAIEYVKKNMKRYVSKPDGDVDKALSYVSKSPRDMVMMLERWKEKNPNNKGFILQEFQGGIEMAVGGWFGKNGWSQWWCENFEHKKLMPGDSGVNCYSDDTEVLTLDGWKFWSDVVVSDEICTLVDDKIEFEKPSILIAKDFEGELIGWESSTVDILVTPGHRMYVQDSHARNEFFFEPSDITEKEKRKVLRGGGVWVGEDVSEHLPYFYKGSLTAWAALVGAYIADGNAKERSIVFGNCPKHKQDVFIDIASAAGYSAKLYGKDLYINSKELATHFKNFGLAIDKYIPQYLKDATPDIITSFLFGYGIGDGNSRINNKIYSTSSRKLANDLQEIILKIGKYGGISTRDRRGESHIINGYLCTTQHISYDVNENSIKLKANLCPEISYRKPYVGKVYCCEVKSHIIYVRRNGKACWLGQTGEQGTAVRYTKDSRLADELLKPLTAHLKSINYRGYFDMAAIIDDKGTPWPLEATSRPGWPIRIIQDALHVGDPAQWMLDLLNGKDTLDVLDEIAIGVVVTIPDYPFTEYTGRDVEGFPVYNTEHLVLDCVHLCEVMAGTAPDEENGKIIDRTMPVTCGDYVLIASGTDYTVTGAQMRAKRAIKKVEIPNSPGWRDDIGERLEKELPLLQEHEYAIGWKY